MERAERKLTMNSETEATTADRQAELRALLSKRLHFMGIGGQGISALARLAQANGATVSGCDRAASVTTHELAAAGIDVTIGHSAQHLQGQEALVITPAVPALEPDHQELVAAQQQGLPVVTWQELLGALTRDYCLLSVCGVHGKGTTTSLLALMLVEGGFDPTCVIGAVVPAFGANYRLGKGHFFINEADEFNHNFWHYHPRLTVVTSIEYEHPEFFADYETFLQAFTHFIQGMDLSERWPLPPTLVMNADSPGCLELRARLGRWSGRTLFYTVAAEAIREKAEQLTSITVKGESPLLFEAHDLALEGETSFRVRLHAEGSRGTTSQARPLFGGEKIALHVPGLHNVQNALGAIAAAQSLGVSEEAIRRALEGFRGSKRRFEIRHQGPLPLAGRTCDVMLIDDYAHHPTAIAATLAAARQRYPQRRLIAVYQPHMYSRTKVFFEQFVEAFDEADVVVISDIFPARERDTGLVHARDLVAALAQRPRFREGEGQVLYGGDRLQTEAELRALLRDGDLALIMGAGDIYSVTNQLLGEGGQSHHQR
ncbi:UDP-N-acetylmuramate--L-alanine ligase [Thermogemmatispora carboxidivorans]|uniref:UDP-N-acetylmuramate--L-alanine ligase n=1 Tax=Thermogemmatispora carboxidivorans TaxID=1382306 RepID=UPI00069A4330|nr:UDP-N-acetylmuramate--L-alanine ligase [Thermogemmatispora carboxidivorans]